jgi:hypothetical protein
MGDRVTYWASLAGLCAGFVLCAAGVTSAAPALRVEVVGRIVAVKARHFIMFDDLAFLTTAMSDFLGSDHSAAR